MKTQKIKWIEKERKFTAERNYAGVLMVFIIILSRVMVFPKILTEMNVIYSSDALLLIVSGWFIGRMNLLSNNIEENVFSCFEKNYRVQDKK